MKMRAVLLALLASGLAACTEGNAPNVEAEGSSEGAAEGEGGEEEEGSTEGDPIEGDPAEGEDVSEGADDEGAAVEERIDDLVASTCARGAECHVPSAEQPEFDAEACAESRDVYATFIEDCPAMLVVYEDLFACTVALDCEAFNEAGAFGTYCPDEAEALEDTLEACADEPNPGDWTCHPAQYDSGIDDDCDCGCGAIDPDCTRDGVESCTEAGCFVETCDFCTDDEGDPIPCSALEA